MRNLRLAMAAAMIAVLACAIPAQSVEPAVGVNASAPLLEQREERVNPQMGIPYLAYTARREAPGMGREWVAVSLASLRSVFGWGGELEAHLNLATEGKAVKRAWFQLAGSEEAYGVFDAVNQVVWLRYEDLVRIQLLYRASNPGEFRQVMRFQLVVEIEKGVRMTDTFLLFFHNVRHSNLWISQTVEVEFTNWQGWQPADGGDALASVLADTPVPAETLREIVRFYRMVGWSKADPVNGGMGAFYHAQRPQSQLWSNAPFVEVKFRDAEGRKAKHSPRMVALVLFVDPDKVEEVSTESICQPLQRFASRQASLALVRPDANGKASIELPAAVKERLAGRAVHPLVLYWTGADTCDVMFVINQQVINACYDDMKYAVLAHSEAVGDTLASSGLAWHYAEGGFNGDIVPVHQGTESRTLVWGNPDESDLLGAFSAQLPSPPLGGEGAE